MARSKVTDVPMALAVKIELFKRGCFDFITVKAVSYTHLRAHET